MADKDSLGRIQRQSTFSQVRPPDQNGAPGFARSGWVTHALCIPEVSVAFVGESAAIGILLKLACAWGPSEGLRLDAMLEYIEAWLRTKPEPERERHESGIGPLVPRTSRSTSDSCWLV